MTDRILDGGDLVARADAIAERAHEGQTDKAGEPYIGHPRRVADWFDDPHLKTAALLHDVLEDGELEPDDLREQGIPDDVIATVQALTKQPDEEYAVAVRRAAEHPMARHVKAADVADNADPDRLALLDPDDAQRLRDKYALARRILNEVDRVV